MCSYLHDFIYDLALQMYGVKKLAENHIANLAFSIAQVTHVTYVTYVTYVT